VSVVFHSRASRISSALHGKPAAHSSSRGGYCGTGRFERKRMRARKDTLRSLPIVDAHGSRDHDRSRDHHQSCPDGRCLSIDQECVRRDRVPDALDRRGLRVSCGRRGCDIVEGCDVWAEDVIPRNKGVPERQHAGCEQCGAQGKRPRPGAGRGVDREEEAEDDPGEPDQRGRCGVQSPQLAQLSELRFAGELEYDADALLPGNGRRRAILTAPRSKRPRYEAREDRGGDDAGDGHSVHCGAANAPTRRQIGTIAVTFAPQPERGSRARAIPSPTRRTDAGRRRARGRRASARGSRRRGRAGGPSPRAGGSSRGSS
jgi:hypothetical protein